MVRRRPGDEDDESFRRRTRDERERGDEASVEVPTTGSSGTRESPPTLVDVAGVHLYRDPLPSPGHTGPERDGVPSLAS